MHGEKLSLNNYCTTKTQLSSRSRRARVYVHIGRSTHLRARRDGLDHLVLSFCLTQASFSTQNPLTHVWFENIPPPRPQKPFILEEGTISQGKSTPCFGGLLHLPPANIII